MATLFLHIGSEKTGTTAIQKYCAQHSEAIKGKGLFYLKTTRPFTFGSRKFAAFFQEDKNEFYQDAFPNKADPWSTFETFYDDLVDEVSAAKSDGFDKFLISSEHLYSRLKTTSEISNLSDAVHSIFDRVEIIFFMREQVDLLISSYSTSLRRGDSQSPSEYFSNNFYLENPFLNFELGLKTWEYFFDKSVISIEMYEKALRSKEALPHYFLNLIGIDATNLDEAEFVNKRLGGLELQVLRTLNQKYDFDRSAQSEMLRALESLNLPDISFGSLLPEWLDKTLFSKSNEKLMSSYQLEPLGIYLEKTESFKNFEEIDYESVLLTSLVHLLAFNGGREKLIGALDSPIIFEFEH